MKKIMFIIGCLAGGGAERVVSSIASSLAEKDFQVSILTYYKEENEYPYSSKINRINISNGSIIDFNKMSAINKLKLIRKNIKKEQPDEIICFLSHPSVFAYLATVGSKYKKRISFAIRANPNMENNRIAKIQKRLLKHVKRIITQNKGQTTCFSPKLQKKMVIIPNPMYDELFINKKNYSSVPTKIVSVGRLNNQKNYKLAIEAFEIVYQKYSNIEYFIYGVGALEMELKELIRLKKLENNVHIMGFEKDRNKIYSDKDIFLMTSKFEGMPNALAEAMCMGIPSISTDCDFGPRDLIMNDDMGILLKDYEVETLVNSLVNVISDYDEYIIKAKYAREVLKEKYSFDKVVNIWESILQKEK